jgi:hypothetical protein
MINFRNNMTDLIIEEEARFQLLYEFKLVASEKEGRQAFKLLGVSPVLSIVGNS